MTSEINPSASATKPLEVFVSSVNTPDGPNAVALVPESVNSNVSPNPAADVSLTIIRSPTAESINVHVTASAGETVTIIPSSVSVVATELPVHVTLERFHPGGIVVSFIV